MRVAFDVTVSSRVTTGVGVYARQLFPALVNRGLDMRRWQQPIGPTGVRLVRVWNGLRLATWEIVGVPRRAQRERIDLVHSTSAFGPLRAGFPLLMTVHDAMTVTMPTHASVADRTFERVFALGAARRADAVVVPTQTAAAAVAEHFRIPPSRIRVVPLGVAQAFRHVTQAQLDEARRHYTLDRPFVLYVGADTPRKNLATLVRAMARLGPGLADLELVVAGPRGPRDAELDIVARQVGLRRPIRRLGEVPDRLLPAVYGCAAGLAYVSLCEGFGLPILEAMAVGVPVVTSVCSSMPEVAGGAALLVDPTSVDALADALERVVSDSALAARLRQQGRCHSANFDWSRTAELTEDVYRELTGRRR